MPRERSRPGNRLRALRARSSSEAGHRGLEQADPAVAIRHSCNPCRLPRLEPTAVQVAGMGQPESPPSACLSSRRSRRTPRRTCRASGWPSPPSVHRAQVPRSDGDPKTERSRRVIDIDPGTGGRAAQVEVGAGLAGAGAGRRAGLRHAGRPVAASGAVQPDVPEHPRQVPEGKGSGAVGRATTDSSLHIHVHAGDVPAAIDT